MKREKGAPLAAGSLYVVATPIGNMSDLSPRAADILQRADLVVAEDTRSFKRLAANPHVLSYFEHNEQQRVPQVLALLAEGKSVALVSEAGTPTISDPGYRLVRACRQAGYSVLAVPGPSAAVAALSISGLPSDRFSFEGFLPVKEGKKRRALEEAIDSGRTAIFYESPHRIKKTISLLASQSPECQVFVCRELTKIYEECFFGSAAEVTAMLAERESLKGEFVLIISAPNG